MKNVYFFCMYGKLSITRFFWHLAIFNKFCCCRLMNIFLTQFWTENLLIHKPQPCHMLPNMSLKPMRNKCPQYMSVLHAEENVFIIFFLHIDIRYAIFWPAYWFISCSIPLHNGEPSVVTWNYENIISLRVVIWSQTINTTYHF